MPNLASSFYGPKVDKPYSDKLADYLGGVVVGAVICAKGHKDWKLTQRDNERMVLWLVSKQSKRFNIFVFAVVILPTKIRLIVNGSVHDVAGFFEVLCSSVVNRMRSASEGTNVYSYCVLNNFRVYTMSELNREFAGCAIAPVVEGGAPYIDTPGLYNSYADAIKGESAEMTRAYAPEPILSRLRLLPEESKFKLKYRRLPNCEQLSDEEYRSRLDKLLNAELDLHRQACEVALGELAARQRLRA